MFERREETGISWGLIIPIIWLIRIASRGIGYWLNPDSAGMSVETDYLKGSPLDRTFFIILEVLGVIVLFSRKVNWGEFVRNNKLLIFLYIYMGISVLWSDFPEVSFRRWVRSLGDILMVLIVITEINHSSAVLRLFRSMAYILIPISIILIKYYRNLGVTYDDTGAFEMWVGVTTHKNSLGQLACVSAVVLVWTLLSKYYKSNLFDIPILLISLFLLNGSKTSLSRTSFGVFIFAMVVLFILKLLKDRVKVIRIFTCILIPTIIIGNLLTNYLYSKDIITMVILSTGGDPTLTGRTTLWEAILQIASHHQLLGAGYGGFWIGNLGNNLWDTFIWKPGAAHNGYIDVYVDLGLVGVTILIFLIIYAYKDILRSIEYESDFGKFRMMMFVMILVYNYTESSFFKPTALLWFSFLIISIKVPELFPEGSFGVNKKMKKKKNYKNNKKEIEINQF